MTKLLEKAIESVRDLTPTQQDAIAQIMLDELESDRQWEARLSRHDPRLERLADKAWAEHKAGQSVPLDPDLL